MRPVLAQQGEVLELEMSGPDGGRLTGFAAVRVANGSVGRSECTGLPDPAVGEHYYKWHCSPVIDQVLVDQMEDVIRRALASRGTVLSLEMRRVDNSHMTGFALLRVAGRQVRTICNAVRAEPESADFNWRCDAPRPAPRRRR